MWKKLFRKVKCFTGFHKPEIIRKDRYDLLSDMEVVGNTDIVLEICKYCNHTTIDEDKMKFHRTANELLK